MNIEHALLRELRSAIERFGLSDVELAAVAGWSVPTAREARMSGRLPEQAHCRRGLTAFLERARHARTRSDLTIAA